MSFHHKILTHWGRDKWPPFRRRHLQAHFLERKCPNFNYNFTELCSQESNWQYSSIGPDNALATNHYLNQWWLVYWRIYAALGLNGLTSASEKQTRTIPQTVPGPVIFMSKYQQCIWNAHIHLSNMIQSNETTHTQNQAARCHARSQEYKKYFD